MKRTIAFVLVAGSFTGVRESAIDAQTTAAPSVTVRRNAALNGSVLTGDFNGDGIVDLVAQDSRSAGSAILIALGKGDGTFGAPIRSGVAAAPLAVGDFNEDGKVDLLVHPFDESPAGPIAVMFGGGDGTLRKPARIGTATTLAVAFGIAGDIDGDGNLDAAVAFGGEADDDAMFIYAGRGDGTFTDEVARLDMPGVAAGPNGGAIADLNGDGRPDVVVANHNAHAVSVFLNQGAFTFTSGDIALDAQANDVAIADVNHDGKMDLLVATSQGSPEDLFYVFGFVYVLLGNGNGTFAPPVKYFTAPGAWQLVVGDFDRDGILDVATANRSAKQITDWCGVLWDSVSILRGKTDGTFGPESSFSLGKQDNLTDPRFRNTVLSLKAADVNGDHQLDLIASWGAIFINQARDPNWPPQVLSVTATEPDPIDHSILLSARAIDSDQDFLRWRWTDDHGQFMDERTATPCRFIPETLGVHRFDVTVDDGHGHTAPGAVIVDFGSSTGGGIPPSITVMAPAAGAVLDEGRAFTLRWDATSSAALTGISVSASSDDGGHFQPIAECASLPGSATSCTWNAAKPVTNFGRIRVTASDSAGHSGSGTSGRFVVRAAPGAQLPYGWSHGDVGNVPAVGSASHDGLIRLGQGLTVSGGGADIWGTADEFHYAWQTMSGDFEIEARVASVQAVNAWTKAGLMIRANALDPASPHASIFVTAAKGVVFQRRASEGATSITTSGSALVAPVWLRMVRQGAVLSAYYKQRLPNPWKLLGQQTITGLPSTLAVGLAVTSHVDGTLATAKFEGVYLSAIPAWTTTGIGGATGSAGASNATIYTIKSSGSDIWGGSDSFTYMWVPIHGFTTVTAHVTSLANTNVWAKAGLMVRESLAPGAKQVDGVVTPGKGIMMQTRLATDGVSTNVGQKPGVAPAFFRIATFPSQAGRIVFVQVNYSFDGNQWPILGQAHVDMNGDAYIGIAVTSHNASVETAATFDTVRVER
jgi:hypothetical protein